jgi:hypothetical protein
VIAGGPAPFIATALFAGFHSSLPIAIYILMCDHRPRLDRAADGLHQQGDFGRIQKRLNGLTGRWRASPTRSAQKSCDHEKLWSKNGSPISVQAAFVSVGFRLSKAPFGIAWN